MSDGFPNVLRHLHQQDSTEFLMYDGLEIVSTFGIPQIEYSAVHKGCGLMDLPQRGILQLEGKDRLDFINRLLTNQTKSLTAGQGVYTYLLNQKGRILADINVIERGEQTLLEMDVRLVSQVRQALDRYLFAEKVTMTSRVGQLHQIAMIGPEAAAVLHDAAGVDVADLPPLGSLTIDVIGRSATLWRDDATGKPGYHLLLSAEDAPVVWLNLLSHFGAEGTARRRLVPIGWAMFNAARIEAGRPLFGIDFTDANVPAETAQMDRAVHLAKGCYVGQEVVARMYARKQVAKSLAGIRMEDDALPFAGEKVLDEAGAEIGVITSSTISPVLSNIAICLAQLKKPWFTEGSVVHIPAEGAIRKGTVVKMPFV